MKKLILPILYTVLILRPIFLGGSLWANYPDAVNVLPVIEMVTAADKPVKSTDDLKTMNVWVTAYSSVPEETDSSPFITATNKTVQDGFIAANFLPFGTRVRIPEFFGKKIFVVEDRMHRRKDGFVDIWMSTKEEAINFGIHQTNIVVVEMGTVPNPMPNLSLVKNVPNENPALD